ncbi:MAG: hypothetical protein ACYST6_18925 [Planctomycetota bacterium]|jgi:hypothetical protein
MSLVKAEAKDFLLSLYLERQHCDRSQQHYQQDVPIHSETSILNNVRFNL